MGKKLDYKKMAIGKEIREVGVNSTAKNYVVGGQPRKAGGGRSLIAKNYGNRQGNR